ncbi:hypothetical protein C8R44DRAFT_730548 [Mycena epipterygia]|nr:hypothetical protein C8R44DRAFT_730548 [Mycena epipterygia]
MGSNLQVPPARSSGSENLRAARRNVTNTAYNLYSLEDTKDGHGARARLWRTGSSQPSRNDSICTAVPGFVRRIDRWAAGGSYHFSLHRESTRRVKTELIKRQVICSPGNVRNGSIFVPEWSLARIRDRGEGWVNRNLAAFPRNPVGTLYQRLRSTHSARFGLARRIWMSSSTVGGTASYADGSLMSIVRLSWRDDNDDSTRSSACPNSSKAGTGVANDVLDLSGDVWWANTRAGGQRACGRDLLSFRLKHDLVSSYARRGPTIRCPSPPSLRSGVPQAGASQRGVGIAKACRAAENSYYIGCLRLRRKLQSGGRAAGSNSGMSHVFVWWKRINVPKPAENSYPIWVATLRRKVLMWPSDQLQMHCH